METIKIKAPKTKGNEEGFIIINADEFDAKTQELFDESKPEPKKAVKGK